MQLQIARASTLAEWGWPWCYSVWALLLKGDQKFHCCRVSQPRLLSGLSQSWDNFNHHHQTTASREHSLLLLPVILPTVSIWRQKVPINFDIVTRFNRVAERQLTLMLVLFLVASSTIFESSAKLYIHFAPESFRWWLTSSWKANIFKNISQSFNLHLNYSISQLGYFA